MRKLFVILFVSFLFSTGKYGDSFLKIGTSARDIGIGQAIVADIGNASGALKVNILGHSSSIKKTQLLKFIEAVIK